MAGWDTMRSKGGISINCYKSCKYKGVPILLTQPLDADKRQDKELVSSQQTMNDNKKF